MANSNSFSVGNKVNKNTPFGSSSSNITRDLVATVIKFDLNKSVLHCKHKDGRVFEVSIDPKEYERVSEWEKTLSQEKLNSFPYISSSIDFRMERSIPSGNLVQLIRLVVNKVRKEDNVRIAQCKSIKNGGTDDKKCFEALVTMTKNEYNSCDSIQSWDPKSFNVEDKTALAKLAEKLDILHTKYNALRDESNDSNKVTSAFSACGVVFKARKKLNDLDGYKWMHSSGRFERQLSERDEEGNIVTQSAVLNGEWLYHESEKYVKEVKELLGDDVIVEVCSYTSYPVRNGDGWNEEFNFRSDKYRKDFYEMATARSKNSQFDDEDSYFQGGNYGGWGILNIARDVNGKESNFVSNLVMTTFNRKFIDIKIESCDGQKYDLDEGLKGDVMKSYAGKKPQTTQKVEIVHTFQNKVPSKVDFNFSDDDDDIPF